MCCGHIVFVFYCVWDDIQIQILAENLLLSEAIYYFSCHCIYIVPKKKWKTSIHNKKHIYLVFFLSPPHPVGSDGGLEPVPAVCWSRFADFNMVSHKLTTSCSPRLTCWSREGRGFCWFRLFSRFSFIIEKQPRSPQQKWEESGPKFWDLSQFQSHSFTLTCWTAGCYKCNKRFFIVFFSEIIVCVFCCLALSNALNSKLC